MNYLWDARAIEIGRYLFGALFNPEHATPEQIADIDEVILHEDIEEEIRIEQREELYEDPYDNDEGEQS